MAPAGGGVGSVDLRSVVCLDDLERHARSVMDAQDFDYFAGGAETETTLRANASAFARVTLWPGVGDVTCNSKPLDESFPDIDHRGWMIKPFLVTNTMGLFDVRAIVRGGGKSGQAQAVRHGIAKALQLYEPAFRPALKKAGMLTRDPRVVERKKPGRKKARKAFQWVKR